MTIETVGVVGLGNMGLGMAASLVRAGFTVIGHDLDTARRAPAEAAGIAFLPALPEILGRADALVFSLPLARDVEAVVAAEGGLLSRRDRKVVVVDTSTSDPGTTRRLAARLAEAGHALLDAPVSGGPSGAAAGTLTMMVGGMAEDHALAEPVLAALSARAPLVGPSGAGNIVKLVNNLLVAAHLVTTGEAMRLSEAAGLSAAEAIAVVNTANAQRDLARYDKLAKTQYTTAQQADTQRATVAQDEALVRQDQAQIDSAHTNLSYTTITAPVDGRTGIRQVDIGNLVHNTDTTPITVVTTLRPISVVFTLPQQTLPQVSAAIEAARAAGGAVVEALPQDGGDPGAGQAALPVLDRGHVAVLDNEVDPNTARSSSRRSSQTRRCGCGRAPSSTSACPCAWTAAWSRFRPLPSSEGRKAPSCSRWTTMSPPGTP